MVTHSSILAWRIPWTEEPGRLQFIGLKVSDMTELTLHAHRHPGRDIKCEVKVTQLCPTLCDPINCSPPGFSVHGIIQARILEWVAVPSPGERY